MQPRYICIHGHFYQPPRENPWLEEVELQDSAYPFHDWNERITDECYAPNTASRILDNNGRIIDIVNNYAKMSFNFGPTLLSWMGKNKPDIYEAILEADALSVERFSGHGSAIAQVYNHMIMPLANTRDKYTQVIWGIRDFQKRFGRLPEGMWLAETAVDMETLEIMAELGISYTILAPHQAKRVRKIGAAEWSDVSGGTVDPANVYICNLSTGKNIACFFYDSPISHDTAFGKLLKSGERFAERLANAFSEQRDWPQIIHIATDGETYGHHQRSGDMALAYCLYHIESHDLAKLTNFGEYLERHPPTYEVDIIENTSWSCIHGIERWRSDCGCNSGMHPDWNQGWRKPLRESFDWLRRRFAEYFELDTSRFLNDPWHARDEFINVVLDREHANIERFFSIHSTRDLTRTEISRVLKLLELQRNAMLMYTSCGWFFDEVSGVETVQVMQYAAQGIQYVKELFNINLEPEFIRLLKDVPSNVFEDAAVVYDQYVKPAAVTLYRVEAHYAISSIFEEYPEDFKIFSYSCMSEKYDKAEAGKIKLITGKTRIMSELTWDESTLTFAVLNLGDQNITGGVRDFRDDELYKDMNDEIQEAFERSDIPEVIRRMDKHFGTHNFTLWHLFKDEQRKIVDQILQLTYEGIESSYRQIYENNYSIMNFFHTLKAPIPRPLLIAVEYIVNLDLKRCFEHDVDIDDLERLIGEVHKWTLVLDKVSIGYEASRKINDLMDLLSNGPNNVDLIVKIENIIRMMRTLPVELDLWKAQNMYYSVGREIYEEMEHIAETGDDASRKWVDSFMKIGNYLGVKVT
jgi:alpha-amylase/alpha-mannosidase (GH57 family)